MSLITVATTTRRRNVRKELGFIGVGPMGIHMAGRLIEAGYALTVFDTNETAMQRLEQRGATRAESPAAVASKCETVLVSLPTPDVVRRSRWARRRDRGQQGEDLRGSLDHRAARRQGGRRRGSPERHHRGRCAGERRPGRRREGHAGDDVACPRPLATSCARCSRCSANCSRSASSLAPGRP